MNTRESKEIRKKRAAAIEKMGKMYKKHGKKELNYLEFVNK